MQKRIIKLRNRELYFGPGGKWSSDVRQARSFRSLSEIGEAIEVYGLRNFEFAFAPNGTGDTEKEQRPSRMERAVCVRLPVSLP